MGACDIWQARFSAHHKEAFLHLLSEDEHRRAQRFLAESARTQFVIGRGILRRILSQYTQIAPQDLIFTYGKRGKLSLPETAVRFNLSHSRDVLLIGVTTNMPIGIDVEYIHYIPQMAIMARDNFSLGEQQQFFALPEAQQQRAFFTCWTRKEAYVKATGDGLSMPLANFDVTFMPGESPRMTRAEGDDPTGWRFIHLEPQTGYVGAVCVLGQDFNVIQKSFDDVIP